MSPAMKRRTLLGLSAAAAAGGLAACGTSSGDSGPGSGGGSEVPPPNHQPFGDVTPDLPADDIGVVNGYFSFPDPPVQREGIPLPKTETITALLQGDPPSIPTDSNPVYDHFREQAGNGMEDTSIISTEYQDKFQVTMAGGDLPDLVQIVGVPQLPKLLEKHFTDLCEVLSGSNVEQYPALASFTGANWDVARVNGRIWGVPQPRPPAGRVLLSRGDLLRRHGLTDVELRDGSDFVELLTTVNDPDNNTFALGGDPRVWLLRAVCEMHGVPNNWAKQDGTFVNEISSPLTVEALNESAKIMKKGLLHPKAFAEPGQNHLWFRSGVTPLLFQGFTMWSNYARSNPEFDTGIVRLPQWNGGGPASVYLGAAGFGAYTAIKKQSSDERLHEILRIIDYIASPFGTQQYLDIGYGLEDRTFTFEDGQPTFIEDKAGEALMGWPYVGGGSQNVLYIPGRKDVVQDQHAYLSEIIPAGTQDASTGLYSETQSGKAATWGTRRKDLERSIMLGEKPVSDWTEFANTWQREVGDQMVTELEEAAAQT